MRRTYVVGHWALTLLLAPFTSQALQYIFLPNPHQIVGLLEVYPITLAFSVAFSLPTFLVYLTCFHFLSKHDVKWTISKLILILISVIGVYVTMIIIKGSMSQDIAIYYSLTAFIVGLLLKLKKNARPIPDKPIAT
jgi:hypothetical protein